MKENVAECNLVQHSCAYGDTHVVVGLGGCRHIELLYLHQRASDATHKRPERDMAHSQSHWKMPTRTKLQHDQERSREKVANQHHYNDSHDSQLSTIASLHRSRRIQREIQSREVS